MKIKELLYNSQSRYLIIIIIISAIGFFKSFILLKIFDHNNLGLISLAQTFVSSISLLQFGIVTGGYRLFSYKKRSLLNKINSTVFVFFIYLSILILFLSAFSSLFLDQNLSIYLILLFSFIGIVSLYSNWVLCKILGIRRVEVVNKAQLISVICSFIITIGAYWFGIGFVFLGLVLQPVIVIFIAYLSVPTLIPKYDYGVFKKFFKKIISLGFIPYLTSALTLFNTQLGRWIITFSLGTAILGKTFLPMLFIVLAGILPGAISNLFFPKIIEKYEKKDFFSLLISIKKMLFILVIYNGVLIILTLSLTDILINIFLPKHYEYVHLIYLVTPTVVLNSLSTPAVILFNAAKKFNKILFGGMFLVVTYVFSLVLYLLFFKVEIEGFFILEIVSTTLFFIYNIYHFVKEYIKIKLN